MKPWPETRCEACLRRLIPTEDGQRYHPSCNPQVDPRDWVTVRIRGRL